MLTLCTIILAVSCAFNFQPLFFFLAIWDALPFCSTLGMKNPNSVNDKKG